MEEFNNIPAGEEVALFCPSEGNPHPNISWYKNGKLLTGQRRENGEKVSL